MVITEEVAVNVKSLKKNLQRQKYKSKYVRLLKNFKVSQTKVKVLSTEEIKETNTVLNLKKI